MEAIASKGVDYVLLHGLVTGWGQGEKRRACWLFDGEAWLMEVAGVRGGSGVVVMMMW